MKFYTHFDDYLANVIDSVKELLYARHEDIFERIDFYDDEIYLEPLLYTYLNQQNTEWLDSIIYGYEKIRKSSIKVFSNSEGVIYIPKVGYLITEFQNCEFILNSDSNTTFSLVRGGEEVLYSYEPLLFVSFGIELVKYQHALLEKHFLQGGTPILKNIDLGLYDQHAISINKALNILMKCNKEHFKLLRKTLKKIVLFTGGETNSFATMQAHNMILLNVSPEDNEIYFVDHISHEGAHVTFNTITFKSKVDLFKYDYNIDFSEITGSRSDAGNLYLRFHGLFTFFEITKSLLSCMLKLNCSDEKLHEVEGRFAFQLRRFGRALKRFENVDIFEKEGQLWFDFLLKEYSKLYKKYGFMVEQYDLSLGSYDFAYSHFNKKNPIENWVRYR